MTSTLRPALSTTIILTTLAMIAFAANSVLARLALHGTTIDALSYTAVRLTSAAVMLVALVLLRSGRSFHLPFSALSALALFGYALAFSLAYLRLETGMGALILFGVVQLTMIGWGVRCGERLSVLQWGGVVMACAAFAYLMTPGLSAPDSLGAALMALSGLCWGVYSLLGRGGGDPLLRTASNFIWSLPLIAAACALSIGTGVGEVHLPLRGVIMAMISGAVMSGAGYAIWYGALRGLAATHAGIVQLSVPVIAALGGVSFVAEPLTARLMIASVFILGGIALVMTRRKV